MISNDYTVEGIEFTVHHDGDYSGEVWTSGPSSIAEIVKEDSLDPHGYAQVTVPFELLAKIVADAVLGQRIEKLEQAGYREVLGLEEP